MFKYKEENLSEDFMCGWLRGFFDGEGSAIFLTNKKVRYRVCVYNTDLGMIRLAIKYLEQLNIKCGILKRKNKQKEYWKDVYTLSISNSESILIFSDKIGFFCESKKKKLESMVSWIRRERTKYNIKELRSLYWESNFSIRQIAKKLNLKSGNSVKQLFIRHNIPIRKREEAVKIYYGK